MMIFNLPCSSSPCPLISWSLSSRHTHTHSHTHSHTYTHAHTHTLFVEAKRTHSPIFQSFLFELHLDAPAPPSPLLTPTWGRVSDEVWAERRTLICINLQAISREVARFEGGGRTRASCSTFPLASPPPLRMRQRHGSRKRPINPALPTGSSNQTAS